MSRNTVAKYVTPALAEGIRPGGPPVAEAEWAERIRRWFPDLQDGRLRRVSWPAIAEHRDYIVDQLKRGVTMATIHQRLRDEQGLTCSSASLRRWIGAGLPAAQLRDLAALRWFHAGESIILFGPVGVGKSHIAQSLGQLVIRLGLDVRFIKTSRALSHLAGGHADHTWPKRLAELTRPALLILDDRGMRERTAAQADDLYELISERSGKSMILTSNRAPEEWYKLFPDPVVAESLLDRLINTSYRVFMDGPSYRPNKRPGKTSTSGRAREGK
ncbi:ATP-binding protein [Streptosporangium canum]|uniref:ATP-binding protein n=1 Tax=Streptosporangium canum TaxID=324952 RepID=UPI003429DC2D